MLAAAVAVKVLVVASVKASEAFDFIFNGVRVYDVHDYGYAGFVGRIDKGFQLLGCTEAT